MRQLGVFLVSALCGASALIALRTVDGDALWWKFLGPGLAWPQIESCDLHCNVTGPGRFEAQARLGLSGVSRPRLTLLLNRHLDVIEAQADGVAVGIRHHRPLPSRYHREGRVVEFTLPSAPADGRVSLALRYAGRAERGREGSDWRGILFVDDDEARMCEQTVFVPQVPLSLEGAAVARTPFTLSVTAPRDWEVFVPASGGVESEDGDERTRRFRFVADRPRHPALLGGRRERSETSVGGSRIVTLLRAEHAALAPDFVREAAGAIEGFARRFGPIDAGILGIVEIQCRDASSYNWTAEGVMAFDRGALGGSVPVASVFHEVAHLWWGQSVDATGPGERFLTEGLAEFSAWTALLEEGRAALVEDSIAGARDEVGELTRSGDSLALADIGFGTAHYSTLAYGKGPLVLRCLAAQLDAGRLDAALRRLVTLGADRPVTLDDFLRLVRESSGLDGLQLPWLVAPGDLALAFEEVRVQGGRLLGTIVARPVPAGSALQAAGAPLALQCGGRGWSERRTLLLQGERTPLDIDLEGREPAYVRLDPGDAWTTAIEGGFVVLDGARLLAARPAIGVPAEFGGTRLELQFDRPLAAPTLESLRAAQLGPESVSRLSLKSVALGEDGRTLLVETGPWLPGKRYALALTSLTDRDGLPVAGARYELDVAPSTDVQRPRIVATSPAVGASVPAEGGRLEIALTFDERMHHGYAITGEGVRDIEGRGLRCPDLADIGSWDEDGRTIRWQAEGLQPGVRYALPINARSFRDLSGNPCEPLELPFTIAPDSP